MYLTALAVSGVFYLAYQEWFSWLALLILLGLPWFSLAVSLPAMLKFRSGVLCPQRIPLWGRAEAKLAGWCQLPAPPFRGQVGLKQNFTGENLRKSAAVNLPTAHCGCITVVPEKVRVYDYLGLFALKCKVGEPAQVMVMPKAVKVPQLPELEQFLARAWRPKPGGGFAENHELRLYRPGDSLNQVHWKLSAKTGKLMLREPMVPERGLMLLTMDISGTAEELDRKFGRLLWLGTYLLEQSVPFEVRAMTDRGLESWSVASETELQKALEALLCSGPAAGSVLEHSFAASWQYHVGGGADEA